MMLHRLLFTRCCFQNLSMMFKIQLVDRLASRRHASCIVRYLRTATYATYCTRAARTKFECQRERDPRYFPRSKTPRSKTQVSEGEGPTSSPRSKTQVSEGEGPTSSPRSKTQVSGTRCAAIRYTYRTSSLGPDESCPSPDEPPQGSR